MADDLFGKYFLPKKEAAKPTPKEQPKPAYVKTAELLGVSNKDQKAKQVKAQSEQAAIAKRKYDASARTVAIKTAYGTFDVDHKGGLTPQKYAEYQAKLENWAANEGMPKKGVRADVSEPAPVPSELDFARDIVNKSELTKDVLDAFPARSLMKTVDPEGKMSQSLANFGKSAQVPNEPFIKEGPLSLAEFLLRQGINIPGQIGESYGTFINPKTDNVGVIQSGVEAYANAVPLIKSGKVGYAAWKLARDTGKSGAEAIAKGVGTAVADSMGISTPEPKPSSFEEFRNGAKKAGDVSGIVPEFRQPIAKMPENRIDSLSPQGRALESWAGNNLQKLLDNGVGSDLRTWDAVGKHYGAGAVPRNAEDLPMWVNDLVHSVDQNDRTVSAMADLHGRGGDLHNDIVSMREAVGKTRGNMPGQTGVVAIVRQGRGYRAVQNSGWVPLEAVPMHLRRSVMDRVGSSETMFTSRANYQAWVDAGKPEGGVLRPRMADEYMLDSFGGNSTMDDFIMSPPKEAMVPRWAVRDELRNMTNQYQKAGEAAAAMRKPLKPQHFDEAVKHYNGEAVSAPVETAPTVKPVASRPASKPVAPKEEAKAAQDVATESGGDLVGYAKQISGNDPLPGVSRKQLLKDGEEAIATGKVNPDAFVDNVIKRGKGNGDESATVASLVELRRIRNRQMEIEKLNTPEAADEWTKLQDRADKYVQAGDLIGNDWHRMGMALQVAIKQDMSLGSLESRAKLLNSGQDVSADVKSKLQKLSEDHAKALKEIEKLKSNNADVMDRIKTNRIEPRHAVRSREKARSVAADYFKGKNLAPDGGVGKNRQRGAVSYTITPEEARAKSAIRKLAKEIALDGAETLDDVLNGIRKEIGVPVKDEDLLAFIYEPYSKYRIEADVARIKSNQALADVQRAAEFRALSNSKKVGRIALGVMNGVQRSFQAGADFSAPLIQGRKGIFANPIGWAKSYDPMLRAAFSKRSSDVAVKELAKIEAHTMYPRAKAAGLQLTVPGGKFTAQEETFAGNISQMIDAIDSAKNVGKAGVIAKPYLRVLEASEDAFTTYMNALRYDTFVKMSKAAPDDPAYLKDVAELINVIYGRGTGKFARAVGEIGGEVFFAPRYLVSNIQYQSGVPVWKSNTGLGRRKALQIYATHAASVGGLMYIAKLSGWQVGTDPRATDFGKISKGGVTIDLAAKDTQFIRLMTQTLYGKVNKDGKFTKPSGYSAATNLGMFAQNKVSPGLRTLSESLLGVYDDSTGKTRDMNQKDAMMKVAPLWVQDLIKDSDKWEGDRGRQAAATIAAIFGLESKPGNIPTNSTPLNYSKPGIKQKS